MVHCPHDKNEKIVWWFMTDRYNIYDWVGDRSKDRLRQLLSKYDIKVDETKQNKQEILSQVLNTLQTAAEVFELKKIILTPDPLDKRYIEVQNQEKQYMEAMCNLAAKRKQIQRDINEAVSMFVIAEKMKEMHSIIRDLNKQESEAKFQMMQQAYQAAAQQMQQQLLDNLDRLEKQTYSDMLKHKANIDRLDKNIARLEALEKSVFKEGALETAEKQMELEFSDGTRVADIMTKEQAAKINEDYFLEKYQSEIELDNEIESTYKEIEQNRAQRNAPKVSSSSNSPTSNDTFLRGYRGAQGAFNSQEAIRTSQLDSEHQVLLKKLEGLKQKKEQNGKATPEQDTQLMKRIVQKNGISMSDANVKEFAKPAIEDYKSNAEKAREYRRQINDNKAEKAAELSQAKSKYDVYKDAGVKLNSKFEKDTSSIKMSKTDELFAMLNQPTQPNTSVRNKV
uniref:Uncharacterized protein n=1 Tax=Candidatus Berkiella aquae TaxID=295108 RepID=A0A0Q9YZX6_9GAMM